jgi:catalase (peroxidase I)
LAWHCAGTYRISDGNGGCDGSRIRYAPEKDWDDNKGLIMADDDGRGATIDVLEPIKEKYGSALSWADLIVLSGTVAIKEMGGPEPAFCGGRMDDSDGSASMALNTSMIYVDAGAATAADIRKAFTQMGMDDREAIALIAGGHTFGRCHSGRTGFHGPWTTTPSTWSNQYLENLLTKTWVPVELDNGLTQMKPTDNTTTMMLVADYALLADASYKSILEEYHADPETFKADFGEAWTKLMNGGRLHICDDTTSSPTPSPTPSPVEQNNQNTDTSTQGADDANQCQAGSVPWYSVHILTGFTLLFAMH